MKGTQEAVQEALSGIEMKRCLVVTLVALATFLATVPASAGVVDVAATLVARTCEDVTQRALEGTETQPSVGAVVELWMTGEASGDMRITLWKTNEGRVKGQMATTPVESGPVCKQLKHIYKSDPSLTIASAAEQIEVTINSFSDLDYPGLPTLFAEIDSLTFSANLSESIFFPARNFRLEISNGIESASIEFQVPEPSVEGVAYSGSLEISQPEAATWVEKILKLVASDSADTGAESRKFVDRC